MSATNPSRARIFLLLVISAVLGTFVSDWFVDRQPDRQLAPKMLTETLPTQPTP
jgi:uncharacterized membrane protein YwzB